MPEVRRVDSSKMICIEETGPYRNLKDLFEGLKEFLKLRRLSFRGEAFAIVYDSPVSRNWERMHFAAALELAGETTGNGEVIIVTKPAGWMACELHRGPWHDLPGTYERLMSWIETQGYRVNGPAFEYFLEGVLPSFGEAIETAAVEIQIPVDRISA